MGMIVCPHCKAHRIVTSRVPKDVVVVVPCPACHELSVLFRGKVIPISRRILERGAKKERIRHLAHIIEEFLEAGVLPLRGKIPTGEDESFGEPEDIAGDMPFDDGPPEVPISEKELEKFVRIDLKHIDNPTYFKRHFG